MYEMVLRAPYTVVTEDTQRCRKPIEVCGSDNDVMPRKDGRPVTKTESGDERR